MKTYLPYPIGLLLAGALAPLSVTLLVLLALAQADAIPRWASFMLVFPAFSSVVPTIILSSCDTSPGWRRLGGWIFSCLLLGVSLLALAGLAAGDAPLELENERLLALCSTLAASNSWGLCFGILARCRISRLEKQERYEAQVASGHAAG